MNLYRSVALDQPTGATGNALYSWLGYFWKNLFKDSRLIREQFRGTGLCFAQFYLEYLEWVSSNNVSEVPIFHRKLWTPIVLRKSAKNTADAAPLLYGSEAVYGPQGFNSIFIPESEMTYGGGLTLKVSSYPLDSSLKDIGGVITDTPVNSSAILLPGTDYIFKDDALFFLKDPFENSKFARRQLLGSDGTPVDEELILWCMNGYEDVEQLHRSFGNYFQIKFPSSEYYAELLKKLWFTCREGPAVANLSALLCAMGGIPSVENEEETVEKILTDGSTDELLIITDAKTYRFPAGSEAVVKEGEKVRRGGILTDAVEISDFNVSSSWWVNEAVLVLGENFLNMSDFSGELVVKNDYEPVKIAGQYDGHYLAEFKVYGKSEDVEAFWNKVHAREASAGVYLSELIGASPASPKVLNPMDFICRNFLKNNTCAVRVKLSRFYDSSHFNDLMGWFRQLKPSHVNFLFFVELSVDTEEYELDAVLDPISPYGARDLAENIVRAVLPDVITSTVVENTGTFAELTYKEGALFVKLVPGCD